MGMCRVEVVVQYMVAKTQMEVNKAALTGHGSCNYNPII
jgi:hypothetical protein